MTPDRLKSVLTINASVAGGGAERIALSLHEEYLARGLDAWLLVGNKNAEAPNTIQIPNDSLRNPWARALLSVAWKVARGDEGRSSVHCTVSRALRLAAEPIRYERVLAGYEDFDFPQSVHLLDVSPVVPDVLHLHNLHGGYFDIRALPALSAKKPTILTLHDTWALTGHCANPLSCERWGVGCGECPFLDTYVPIRHDKSAENKSVKREALLASEIGLAVPSSWLMQMVERSGLLGGSVEARVVPNGVDTRVFHPADRKACREALGLPRDRTILMFAARAATANPFKDYATLERALGAIGEERRSDLMLVAVGDGSKDAAIAGVETRFVPFVDDPAQLARYLCAADVYVHPTRAESFGLAVAEAMACGIPVVASRVGGLSDVVVHDETGLLVPQGDAEALAEGILTLVADPARRARMGAAAAARVLDRFTLTREADTYIAWYEELLERRAIGARR